VGCICSKSKSLQIIGNPTLDASPAGLEVMIEFTDIHSSGRHWVTVFDPVAIAAHAEWVEDMSRTHTGWQDMLGAESIAQALMDVPQRRNAQGEIFLPLSVIAALRNQTVQQDTPVAQAFSTWARTKLGKYADASVSIPNNAFTNLDANTSGASATLPGKISRIEPGFQVDDSWCGDWVKLDKSCAPGCPSGPKPSCTGCVCAGNNKKIMVIRSYD
jgi:hypothetical protein